MEAEDFIKQTPAAAADYIRTIQHKCELLKEDINVLRKQLGDSLQENQLLKAQLDDIKRHVSP